MYRGVRQDAKLLLLNGFLGIGFIRHDMVSWSAGNTGEGGMGVGKFRKISPGDFIYR
jgi:hypothetical protein